MFTYIFAGIGVTAVALVLAVFIGRITADRTALGYVLLGLAWWCISYWWVVVAVLVSVGFGLGIWISRL